MSMNGFEVIDSWLTPTVLFFILNLTIVTIFLLKPHEKLKKLIDIDQFSPVRIRPFPFESIQSTYLNEPQLNTYNQETYHTKLVRPVQSLLELVNPIKVSLFRSKPQSEPVHVEPIHVARTRSDVNIRKEMKNNLITSYYHETPVSNNNMESVSNTTTVKKYLPQFVQVQSLLEPIKLAILGSDAQSDEAPSVHHEEPVHARDSEKKSHVRSRSDMVRTKHVKKVLRKSMSEVAEAVEVVEKRRPVTVREKTSQNGDEAVDAKADDFIFRFRKQLKLQRMAPQFEMHGNVEQRDWEVSGGIELLS